MGGGEGFCSFSPTAESFGVSAQIGSGVVRGDPELRFHQGSTIIPPSARFPPGFHQVLQGLRGGLGWFEVRFHEAISSRAAGWSGLSKRFHKGFTRVPPGFHHLQGWGGLRCSTRVLPDFHQGSARVSPGSERAAGWAMKSEGFHQILQKLWGSPEERFQQSFPLSSTKVA